MPPPFDLATVEAPFFEPLVGQTFTASSADGTAHALELISARAYPCGGSAEVKRAPFSLLFKPAARQVLAQGTYECEGPGIEQTGIFLVPVRAAAPHLWVYHAALPHR